MDFSDLIFLLINVYGPSSILDKRNLWTKLSQIIQHDEDQRFIVGGDFNGILSDDDNKGGISPHPRTIQDFLYFITNNQLLDVIPHNGSFTWTTRQDGFLQIAKRLDRFFISQSWKLLHISFNSKILAVSKSDHFPLLLNVQWKVSPQYRTFGSSFKFESMLFRHPCFEALLKQWWTSAPFCRGTKMFQFSQKLKSNKL